MVFQIVPLLLQLALGVAVQVIGYMLAPSSATAQPDEVTDMDDPTAESGRPIPVLFGEMEITGVNIIWFGEKETTTRKVAA